MDAEFVNRARLAVGEFYNRPTRVAAPRPRDPPSGDNLGARPPGHIDRDLHPRKTREGAQQLHSEMRAKSALRQSDVRPVNKVGIGYREIGLMKQRHAGRHTRFEPVRVDQKPLFLTLTALELRGKRDIEERVAGSRAHAAFRSRIDVFEQKRRVFINAQIERDFVAPTTDVLQALQPLKWLLAPQGAVFREEIINVNLVGDPQLLREREIP
jgi:hypothetical protein